MDRTYLDWPFLEQEHWQHARSLKTWARSALGRIDHDDTDHVCRKLVARLGEAGWLAPTAPAPDEAQLDVRRLCMSREILARHDGLADFAFAMQGLGMGAVSLFGNAAQRHERLALTRAGKAIAAFSLTDPGSGSDVANGAMTARHDGRGYVLNGEGAGARGLSAFLAPADTAGLKSGRAPRDHRAAPAGAAGI